MNNFASGAENPVQSIFKIESILLELFEDSPSALALFR